VQLVAECKYQNANIKITYQNVKIFPVLFEFLFVILLLNFYVLIFLTCSVAYDDG